MAFLGFKVPEETAKVFQAFDVPGQRETFSHITVLHLGGDMKPEEIGRALEVAYDVASKMDPFVVRTDKITCFPGGVDGVPIICPIESEALHTLWGDLGKAFDGAGISFSKKFPVYKPHVTLAYARDAIKDRSITPIEWTVYELVLWGGSHKDFGVRVHMPFHLRAACTGKVVTYDLRRNAARRVAYRYRAGK